MNDDRTQPDSQDAVDRLVAHALAGEPDVVTVERLRRFWRAKSAAQQRRRWAARCAAAALVLIAVGVGWMAFDRGRAPDLADGERARPIAPQRAAPTPAEANLDMPAPASAKSARLVSRSSTPYERIAFAALTGGPPPRVVRSPERAPQSVADRVANALRVGASPIELLAIGPIDEVCDALLRIDDDRAVETLLEIVAAEPYGPRALDALAQWPSPPVDALFRMLDHERRTVRRAAALALGRLNGPVITDRLIAIVTERDKRHVEAWMALVACRGDQAKRLIVVAAREPRLLGYFNAAVLAWSRPTH